MYENDGKPNKLLAALSFAGHGSGTTTDDWKPPLQKHANASGTIEFSTIKVRIFGCEGEKDILAKFDNGPLHSPQVCDYIANRLGLGIDKKIFSLWVIGRDLELQIPPSKDIFKLMANWHKWNQKYTCYPEASNPDHPINRYWFVFRREALTVDKKPMEYGEEAVKLLYGEAQHCIITSKYPCTTDDCIELAGLQLQQSQGQYDGFKHKPGYLVQGDLWHYLVPPLLRKSYRPAQWEDKIFECFKTLRGMSRKLAQEKYIDFVKKFPFYGNSFFPCCEFMPPGKYFELRTQHLLIAVGVSGITVIDQDKQKVCFEAKWNAIIWEVAPDSIKSTTSYLLLPNFKFTVWHFKNGKQKMNKYFTPQSPMIENLIQRAVHLHKKYGGNLSDDNLFTTSHLFKKKEETSSTLTKLVQKASEASIDSNARRLSTVRITREENAQKIVTKNKRIGGIGFTSVEFNE